MIDYHTAEQIQAAAQIKEVVEDFLALRRTGSGYKALCPFHNDRNPSLSISPAKNIFKCFVCGEGGTPVQFIMKHEKISYPEALKYLAKKYNIEIKETQLTEEQKNEYNTRESMFIINAFAQQTFETLLQESEEGRSYGLSYLHERGFREDTIKKFHIGYSPQTRDELTRQAIKAGYNPEYLEKTGLSITGENGVKTDRFRGRIIFPIHTISGKTAGFGGRILKNTTTEKIAKYINSPDSETYHKQNELFGIYLARQAITRHDKCYLTEGYTDVISLHQAGIENAVAACGTALTGNQINLIRRYTNNITLINDSDAAGKNASMKDIDKLLEAGINVRITVLPEGEDPDSFARSNNASTVAEYIRKNETNFIQFKAKMLMDGTEHDPAKKTQAVREIISTIALIPEEITRLQYIKEYSQISGYREDPLIHETANRRQAITVQKKKDLHKELINPENIPPAEEQPAEQEHKDSVNEIIAGDQNRIDKTEREILHYVIRYGEIDMANIPEAEQKPSEATARYTMPKKVRQPAAPQFTIKFIAEELKADGLKLSSPLYRQIIEETLARYREAGFNAEKHFLNHPDPEINRLANEIAIDKYDESKIHFKTGKTVREIDKLHESVPAAVINFKNAILDRQIKTISKKIEEAEKNSDHEQALSLTLELIEKNKIKNSVASSLKRVLNI
ncbi:MAG: DNA primase [Dysgonamonadaceae bacterium]|jgi:DNA primase|nr:DNA primase [Dysgonamonadaceae bacterium]